MRSLVAISFLFFLSNSVQAVPFRTDAEQPKTEPYLQNLEGEAEALGDLIADLQAAEEEIANEKRSIGYGSYQAEAAANQPPKSYAAAAPSYPAPAPAYTAPAPAYSAPAPAVKSYAVGGAAYQASGYQAQAYQAPSYAAPVYQAPAPAYQAPSYAAPAYQPPPQTTYTTYAAQPPCASNYLFGCQPSVAPVPCSMPYVPPQVHLQPYQQYPAAAQYPTAQYVAAAPVKQAYKKYIREADPKDAPAGESKMD